MKLNTNAAAAVASIVDPIRRAVEQDRVTMLAPAIAKLQEAGAFSFPEFFASARADRYSRRLIWADPAGRFVVVGMTWAPGQFAPLHDHAGQWGVEAIVEGSMKQTAYRLVDRDAQERYRFMREGEEIAHVGSRQRRDSAARISRLRQRLAGRFAHRTRVRQHDGAMSKVLTRCRRLVACRNRRAHLRCITSPSPSPAEAPAERS